MREDGGLCEPRDQGECHFVPVNLCTELPLGKEGVLAHLSEAHCAPREPSVLAGSILQEVLSLPCDSTEAPAAARGVSKLRDSGDQEEGHVESSV